MNATLTLNTLPRLCQLLGKPPATVLSAIAKLKMVPPQALDGAPLLTDHQTETLRRHFSGELQETHANA